MDVEIKDEKQKNEITTQPEQNNHASIEQNNAVIYQGGIDLGSGIAAVGSGVAAAKSVFSG